MDLAAAPYLHNHPKYIILVKMNSTKKLRKFLSNVLAIVIVVLLVCLVLLLGYYGIRRWNGSYFSQYKHHHQPGLVNPILQLLQQFGWMLLLSLAVVMLVGIFSLLQTLAGKWRTVNVFISYEHQHATIVSHLEAILKDRWIKPVFIPFAPTEHDTLIENVRRRIKSSDLLVVIPGQDKSFVDAEILAASMLEKPILFLRIANNQRTPDTSFKGYPVFDLQKLEQYQYMPLKRFILYIGNSVKDVFKNFARTNMSFYQRYGLQTLLGFFACDTLSIMVRPFISFFVDLNWEQKAVYIIYWTFIGIAVAIFSFVYIRIIATRIQAIRVVRQKIRTGNLTFELLSKGLDALDSDNAILACILKDSLPTRY